jgi:branched-chain amino acid transport system substrate-binding protein
VFKKLFMFVVAIAAAAAFAGTAGASAPAQSSSLGKPNKASGTPITIGFISEGKTTNFDNSGEVQAAQAAVSYANNYLGGIGGKPVKLKVCLSKGTPSGATDCATQMVDAKVPAVIANVSGNMASYYEGLKGSGIPLIAGSSNDQPILLGSDAFVLQNGLGFSISGPAIVAKDAGVTKAAILVIDVPSASGPISAIGTKFYKNAGVDLDVVTVPPGTADMTPQVQAALSKNPGQFSVVGDPTFCASAIKAIKTVGFKGSVVVIPQCIDANSAKAIPGGFSGTTVVTPLTNDPKSPDYLKYLAIMKKYAPGANTGGVSPGGYSTTLGLVTGLAGSTGELTPASVESTLKAMAPTPLPLGNGINFQCNSPITFIPNICSTQVLEGKLNAKGTMTSSKVIDTKDITKL